MAIATEKKMAFKRGKLSDEALIKLYKQILFPRMIEEKMLKLLRQGKISKWFAGIGEEAISVGSAAALNPDEMMFTMHRNLGVFTTRNVPFKKLFAQWQGKMDGFTKGRDRSFHFGTLDYQIAGMISHLGPQLSLADGVALAYKLGEEKKVSLVFTGDGGTSQGEFHEALNVAAVWDLPVIFVVNNNGYGLSTPINEQFKCKDLADKGPGYGMRSVIIDGNNLLEVYHTISKLAEEMRQNPHPVLVECKTFRMHGHEEASGTKYVPQELFEIWGKRDPISNYEGYLLEKGIINEEDIATIRKGFKFEIEEAVAEVEKMPPVEVNTDVEMGDVYKPFEQIITKPRTNETKAMRLVDAISDGLKQAMQKHENLILMGQDIAEYGGVFKITNGFVNEFGKERVRNTPLCESAIVGAALGLSLKGYKSMMEMQFADFVTCGFNQIVNNLAKIHYRWNVNADVVIRMPSGAGVGAGPFHSQTNEAWFTHIPGLKIIYPSSPAEAKGLLLAAFEDPNPILFFEHKALYRAFTAEVPVDYYTLPIGKATLVNEGEDISIITYGMGVHWAKQVVKQLNVSADILDLRSLVPLDYETIDLTVKKTGKVLLLHEDNMFGGIGGELSAYISEHLFEYLDAPVTRVASLDTPIPFAVSLEKNYLANNRLEQKLTALLNY